MKLEGKALARVIAVITKASAAVLAVSAFSMCVAFSAFAAEAPTWSGGFPRLVEKNALLQWDPVKGASEYKVYKTETKDKGFKLVATVKPNRHIDKDLPAGKTFFYYVTAVVDGKETGRSVAGTITTPKEKVFVPLKEPKIVGGHVKSLAGDKVSVGIRWEGAAGSELIGINVYRTKTSGKGYVMIGSSSTDSYEDTDVKRGETYYYAATAVDSNFKETKRSADFKVEVPLPVAQAGKPAEGAKAKEEVKPTKMKPAKLLFRIPRDEEDRQSRGDEPKPENAQDVAVDEAVGHIYVTSLVYGGVLVYNMDGEYQFGIRKDGADGKDKYVAIEGIAVGPGGNIYVADYGGPEVRVFDFRGRLVDTLRVDLSHMSKYKDRIARNYGITIDQADGNIYICDPVANSIHVYDSKHKHLYDITGVITKEEAEKDKRKVLFNGPTYITLTRDKDIVFVDSGYSQMLMYGPGGRFKRTIGKPGMGAGYLYYPVGVTAGSNGEIFVASATTPNIQAFNSKGEFLYALSNEKGDGPISVGTMRGIYMGGNNRMYVTEGLMNRVSVFQLTDKFVEVIPPEE